MPAGDEAMEEELDDRENDEDGAQEEHTGEASARKRPRRPPGRIYASHPGFSNTEGLRSQHIDNLVQCMRRFESARDDARLAPVLWALLRVHRAGMLSVSFQFRYIGSQARASETLMCLYRLLQRHPGTASAVQLRGLLRQAMPFQPSPGIIGQDLIRLELGKLAIRADRVSEARDLLDAIPALHLRGNPEGEFMRLCMLAGIARSKWWAALQHAAQGAQVNPWYPGTAVKAAAGRQGREMHAEAHSAFTKALQVRPGGTVATLALTQLILAQGKEREATRLVNDQCKRVERDADAHALRVAMLLKRAGTGHDASANEDSRGWRRGTAVDVLQECAALLSCCPGNQQAASVITNVEYGDDDDAEFIEKAKSAVSGLCDYLSLRPPALQCDAVTLRAWRVLGDILVRLAHILATSASSLLEARRQARRSQHAAQGDPRIRQGHGDDVDDVSRRLLETQASFSAALATWQMVGRTLAHHAWWLDCHLRFPVHSSQVQHAVREGSATCTTLAALAVVRCAVRGAVRLRKDRGERTYHQQQQSSGGDLSATCKLRERERSTPARTNSEEGVLACVKRMGGTRLSQGLEGALAALSRAQSVERAEEEAAVEASACITSLVNSMHATQGSLPTDWSPIPLGGVHVDAGHVARLETSWWASFPQARRRWATEERASLFLVQRSPPLQPAPAWLSEGDNEGHGDVADGNDTHTHVVEGVGSQENPSQRARRRTVRFTLPNDDDDDVAV